MFGISKKYGFSLLEIVVAIALMVLVATMVIPRFVRKKQTMEEFGRQFNALLSRVYNSALMTGKVHKITLDLDKDAIIAEKMTGEKTASSENIFVPLSQEYRSSTLKIPPVLLFHNVFIEGKDELAGAKTHKVWFFVVPQGLAQNVIMNIVNEEQERSYSLVLNPFTVQLKLYDEFKKSS